MELDRVIASGKEMGLSGAELKAFVDEERREFREREERELKRLTELKREEAAMRREERKQEAEIKREADEREIELLRLRMEVANSENVHSSETVTHAKSLRPKLPKFDEQKDDMDQYLQRFEMFAESAGWPRDTWAVNLSPLLTGMGLSVYTSMPPSEMKNYAALKKELLHRYELTEDGFRKKFRESKADKGETVYQFVARLTRYLNRWQELAETEKTYEALNDLLVREQFVATCNTEMALFLRERKPKNVKELTTLAQQYMEAHASGISTAKKQSNGPMHQAVHGGNRPNQVSNVKAASGRTCFRCHKVGHVAKECRTRAAACFTDRGAGFSQCRQIRGYSPENWRHGSSNERIWRPQGQQAHPGRTPDRGGGNNTAALCTGARIESNPLEDFIREGEIKLADGKAIPIISGGVYTGPDANKDYGDCVGRGYVGNKEVDVLRDTGCSTAAIRRDLVSTNQLTGEWFSCILIDGTIRRFPLAEVEVDTPYYSGTLVAMCMKEPIFDLVIGNIPGAKVHPDRSWSPMAYKTAASVMTRAQKEQTERPIKPLKVTVKEIGNVDIAQLKDEQGSDETLQRYWELQKEGREMTTKGKGIYRLEKRNGVLYRIFKPSRNDQAKEIKQIVVPSTYRNQIMELAHESLVGGHLGAKKTMDRIASRFHWPGIAGDVTRFCRS